ncbi:sulfatase-like hydrolase/transferase [bacterium]|nr:sulfatase-like hydrolase/transferase [bacterium]
MTGRYEAGGNGAFFGRAEQLKKNPESIPPSMPAWFRKHGYTTVSVGKVSHHPGGRGGPDWNDPEIPEMPNSWNRHLLPAGDWQHPRGWMHGLAIGEIRKSAKDMDVFQALAGPDSIYPDGISVDEGLRQMEQLAADADKPFFLAVGILRPHLPFDAPAKYLEHYKDIELPPTPHSDKPDWRSTWHGSGEFMKCNRWNRDPNKDEEFALDVRKHYAACVTYADEQVGKLMSQLKASGADQNTIIVLWGDHGWHLGEHAIWGKDALFEESLCSPLIISYPGIKNPGEETDAMVETLDLLPTLCDLTGIAPADFAHGTSLKPLLDDPTGPGHSAIAYHGNAKTIRTVTHRLIVHKDGYAELYDHATPAGETKNIAEENKDMIERLTAMLSARLEQ